MLLQKVEPRVMLPQGAFVDPITLEPLECPVLASDGVTYSLASLRAAMAADAWHRSPVSSNEVLRELAFPNGFIANYLRVATTSTPVRLFDSRTALPPADARPWLLTLPVHALPEECAVRAQWQLPIAPATLHVMLRRTELGEWWCMHPPPAIQAASAFHALASAFGLGFTKNPACITSALLTHEGAATARHSTVEAWHLRVVMDTQRRLRQQQQH